MDVNLQDLAKIRITNKFLNFLLPAAKVVKTGFKISESSGLCRPGAAVPAPAGAFGIRSGPAPLGRLFPGGRPALPSP